MKSKYARAAVSLAAIASLAGCAEMSTGPAPWGADVLGITASGKLIGFNHGQPGEVQTSSKISGLADGERIVAIDFRPADGKLYGLGSGGGVYVLDTETGKATQKSHLDLAGGLQGKQFDIDFNPSVDKLRVASDAGQNLKVDVDSGATTVDSAWGPGNASIIGAAFTSGGRLYVMNSGSDELDVVMQPGGGQVVTVGAIGSDVDASSGGFDIVGDESSGRAYTALAAADATSSKLYLVKLSSGSIKSQGTIGGGEKIQSLALVPASKA